MGGKILRNSRKLLLSAALVQKRLERITRLLNDLKNYWNQIPIFFNEKTFTVDPVFNKRKNRVVTFSNDGSEHSRVSKTKHPASVIIIGVVALNKERIEQVYRLTHAEYILVLKTKVLPWVMKITKKLNYAFQKDGAPTHTAKTVQDWLNSNMRFYPKDL